MRHLRKYTIIVSLVGEDGCREYKRRFFTQKKASEWGMKWAEAAQAFGMTEAGALPWTDPTRKVIREFIKKGREGSSYRN